jgi:hypothetical protein
MPGLKLPKKIKLSSKKCHEDREINKTDLTKAMDKVNDNLSIKTVKSYECRTKNS